MNRIGAFLCGLMIAASARGAHQDTEAVVMSVSSESIAVQFEETLTSLDHADEQNQWVGLAAAPKEWLWELMAFIGPREMAALCRSCKRLNQYMNSPGHDFYVWKQLRHLVKKNIQNYGYLFENPPDLSVIWPRIEALTRARRAMFLGLLIPQAGDHVERSVKKARRWETSARWINYLDWQIIPWWGSGIATGVAAVIGGAVIAPAMNCARNIGKMINVTLTETRTILNNMCSILGPLDSDTHIVRAGQNVTNYCCLIFYTPHYDLAAPAIPFYCDIAKCRSLNIPGFEIDRVINIVTPFVPPAVFAIFLGLNLLAKPTANMFSRWASHNREYLNEIIDMYSQRRFTGMALLFQGEISRESVADNPNILRFLMALTMLDLPADP